MLSRLIFKRAKHFGEQPMMRTVRQSLVLAAAVVSVSAHAIEWKGDGFATIAAGIVDTNSINESSASPHIAYDESIDFDVDTRLGYQATAEFNSYFSATVQAVVRGIDDYEFDVDWAYLSFTPSDNLSFKAGRLLRSAYKYSDYINVGYAYPWIRPPVEVYSRYLSFFDEIDALSGEYSHRLGNWGITWEAYYGNSSSTAETSASQEEVSFITRNDTGIFLGAEKDALSFRLGYHLSPKMSAGLSSGSQTLIYLLQGAGFTDIAEDINVRDLRTEFFSVAAGYDQDNWFANAEWVRLNIERSLVPDETAWYAMLGHRFGDLSLHYTHANTKKRNKENFTQPIIQTATFIAGIDPVSAAQLQTLAIIIDSSQAALTVEQNSHTLGLRYDFEQPVALKLETTILNDEVGDLKNHFFSLALDFIF